MLSSRLDWRSDPTSFADFPEFFLAHEIAHQWWGQAVTWDRYRDQWLSEGVADYTPVAADRSEYLKHGAEKNEIGLACQDNALLLYLNGKLFRKLDVSRFGLQAGKLGLAVASFENTPVLISFDWLKVRQP